MGVKEKPSTWEGYYKKFNYDIRVL